MQVDGMAKKIGVFGLGSMGGGMARVLVRAGFAVRGFDVVPQAVDRFVADGGLAGRGAEDAADLDICVVVVLNAAQTEDLLFGTAGMAGHLKPGTVILACATVDPAFARRMAERAAEAGLLYLDAPISGGATKAAAGTLTIMASGSRQAFAAARPALDAMAEKVFDLGDDPGAGSAMKAVNQLMAGTQIAVMAEAMAFALTQGISPAKVLEVISTSAGSSFVLTDRGPHVAEGDYTPRSAIDIWPKDLGIVLDIARQARFSAPMAATALQQFLAASGSGLGGEDDAAVIKVYARNAGIALPGEDAD